MEMKTIGVAGLLKYPKKTRQSMIKATETEQSSQAIRSSRVLIPSSFFEIILFVMIYASFPSAISFFSSFITTILRTRLIMLRAVAKNTMPKTANPASNQKADSV